MNPTALKSLIDAMIAIMNSPSNVPGGRLITAINELKNVYGDIVYSIYYEIREVTRDRSGVFSGRSTSDVVYENIISKERDRKISICLGLEDENDNIDAKYKALNDRITDIVRSDKLKELGI